MFEVHELWCYFGAHAEQGKGRGDPRPEPVVECELLGPQPVFGGWVAIQVHQQIPSDAMPPRRELGKEVGGARGIERDDVHDVGSDVRERGNELDLHVDGVKVGARCVHPGIVRVPDRREPRVGHDGTPPDRPDAREELVQCAPEDMEVGGERHAAAQSTRGWLGYPLASAPLDRGG